MLQRGPAGLDRWGPQRCLRCFQAKRAGNTCGAGGVFPVSHTLAYLNRAQQVATEMSGTGSLCDSAASGPLDLVNSCS